MRYLDGGEEGVYPEYTLKPQNDWVFRFSYPKCSGRAGGGGVMGGGPFRGGRPPSRIWLRRGAAGEWFQAPRVCPQVQQGLGKLFWPCFCFSFKPKKDRVTPKTRTSHPYCQNQMSARAKRVLLAWAAYTPLPARWVKGVGLLEGSTGKNYTSSLLLTLKKRAHDPK